MIETTTTRKCCRCKKVIETGIDGLPSSGVPAFAFTLDQPPGVDAQREAYFSDLCDKCNSRLHALMDSAMLVKSEDLRC